MSIPKEGPGSHAADLAALRAEQRENAKLRSDLERVMAERDAQKKAAVLANEARGRFSLRLEEATGLLERLNTWNEAEGATDDIVLLCRDAGAFLSGAPREPMTTTIAAAYGAGQSAATAELDTARRELAEVRAALEIEQAWHLHFKAELDQLQRAWALACLKGRIWKNPYDNNPDQIDIRATDIPESVAALIRAGIKETK